MVLFRVAPEHNTDGVSNRVIFEHAKDGKDSSQISRRRLPESGQRTMIPGLKIHMEDALVPTARARGMFRIVADRVDDGLHEANAQDLRILRHEDDMAELLESDFVNEFGEAGGAGQVQGATGFAAVPVSA